MLGCINKRLALTALFKNEPAIIEVYANKDFSIEKDAGDFFFRLKHPISLPALQARLQNIFTMPCNIGILKSMDLQELKNKRLIWYKGKLY